MSFHCAAEETPFGMIAAATILIVDDDESSGEMLARRLRRQGHEVLCLRDGYRAMAALTARPPDLVLLDIMMPEIDGMAVLRFIRERWDVTTLPVIMVTARDDSADIVAALEAGANDYITKPLDMAVVNARVRTQLLLKQSVAALERANRQLGRLSTLDGLTNVANRRYFDERLDHAVKVAARTRTPLTLVLVDVNHFKALNDTHGHMVGDEALKLIARTLQDNIPRQTDLVARYGGDEFAIILQATDAEGAQTVVTHLRGLVNALVLRDEQSGEVITLHASFGAGTINPGAGTEAGELIVRADQAMYLDKQARQRALQGSAK